MYKPVPRGDSIQVKSVISDGGPSYHSSRTGSCVQQVQFGETIRPSSSYSELTNVLKAPKLSDQPLEPLPSQSTAAGQIRAEFPVKLCPAPFATSILRGNSWTVQANGSSQSSQSSAPSRLRLSAALCESSNPPKTGTQHGITTSISRPGGVVRVGIDKRWVDEDITHYGAIEENCDDFDEWVDRVDVSKFAKDISVDLMSRPRLVIKKDRNPPVISPYPKPGWSYSNLIALALKNSHTGQLTVSEIYAFMLEHFPYFRTAPSGWKNSVRHNLSLNKCFCKVEVDEDISLSQQTRKSCLWMINPQRYDKVEQDIRKWRERNPDTATEGMACPEDLQAIEDGTKGLPAPERSSRQVLKTAYFENRAVGKQFVHQPVSHSSNFINSEDAVSTEDLMNMVKEESRFQRSADIPSHNMYPSTVKSESYGDSIILRPLPDEDLLPTTFPPTETLVATTSFNTAKRSRPESTYDVAKEIPIMDLLPNTFMDAFLSTTPPKTRDVDPDASLSPVRESGFRDAHNALNDNSLLAAALEQSPYKLPVTFPVL